MNGDNGPDSFPRAVEVFSVRAAGPRAWSAAYPRRRGSLLLAIVLFLVTVVSTLAVGAQFALAYANNEAPFPNDFSLFGFYAEILSAPGLLLLGVPFSFTLLGILLAHELGHFYACRYYGIAASYPYFIPAPTLIGTMGAFIRIRSPIVNRKALFDVGLAGPVVGFLFAVPALAIAIAYSKVIPASQVNSAIIFGHPLLERLLAAVFHPGVRVENIFLHPVGRAAWVGLFATALNLIPAGQLDGGHIVYSVASEKHRRISLTVALALILLGGPALLQSFGVRVPAILSVQWPGWGFWGALLLLLGFRHPPLLDRWEPIDAKRRIWAGVAVLIFVLCFMPIPFVIQD
ncbi:MAG: site-2 protease family protein [Acidobacteria bacterium]|nr:site-2 protease family protein [Acidobacteriota bacterium]MBI3662525.1 site-2 protease family protein [Acidobacteriota bacterium]